MEFLVSWFLFLVSFSAPTHFTSSSLGAKPIVLRSPNLGQGSTWMMSGSTLKIKVIGQRSRSRGQKRRCFRTLCLGSLGWMSKMTHLWLCNVFSSLDSPVQWFRNTFYHVYWPIASSIHVHKHLHSYESIPKVHWPPMNKFACKLRGYNHCIFLWRNT